MFSGQEAKTVKQHFFLLSRKNSTDFVNLEFIARLSPLLFDYLPRLSAKRLTRRDDMVWVWVRDRRRGLNGAEGLKGLASY